MNYRVSLAAVNVPPESIEYVNAAMRTGWIGQSDYIARFESQLAAWVGVRHAIAVSCGTLADAVALLALSLRYGKKRVLCPALTFVAQPNAARMAGLEIVFADVNERGLLAELHQNSFLLYPSDCMGRLAADASFFGVEDACEAFGSTFGKRRAGTFGSLGTFSFFVSHSIAIGEGGAIVTDSDELATLCRALRSHGRASETDALQKFHFPHFGFNAKMSGLVAALACGIMEHADEYVARRRAVFDQMNVGLGGRFQEHYGERVIPHGYPLAFESEAARDSAMRTLLGAGIECRKLFSCLPTMEGAYVGWQPASQFPVAERMARTMLYLPCHQNMSEADVDYVCETARGLAGLI